MSTCHKKKTFCNLLLHLIIGKYYGESVWFLEWSEIYFPNFWKYISKSPLWWLIRMRKGAKSGGNKFSMTIWLSETKRMVIWQSYGHISQKHSVAVKKNLLHSLSWATMSKPVLGTLLETSGVGRGALLPSPPHCMGTMKCLCLNLHLICRGGH